MSKKMILKKAQEYIRINGSILDLAKLDIILENKTENSKQIILDYYRSLQNKDGGFPFRFIKNNISAINHTISSLFTLFDYGLSDNLIFKRATKFLLAKQKKGGYWDEQEELALLNPPEWNTPGNLFTDIWLTANASHLILLLKLEDSTYLKKGVEFLLQNRLQNGKINGYLLSNWIAVAIFGKLQGPESNIVKNFISIIEENLEKILGTSDVVWCLRCFLDGGIPLNNHISTILLENILSSQKSNGYWESIDGSEFDISVTLEIIRLLNSIK